MARSSAGTKSNPSRGRHTSKANTPGDVASPLAPATSERGSLPSPPTRLIGREREVEEVRSLLLDEGVRLLTLTGPGGVGKTRLALQVARTLQSEFEGGAFYVPLATLTNPDLVVSLIAQALGVREEGALPVTELLERHLCDKDILLLLDNYEHLTATAHVLTQLLSHAPGVQLLVTSRTPLHLTGEHLYEVTPLSAPEDEEFAGMSLDALTRYEAIELFTDRARAVKPDFALTLENAPAIARICRRLDGLPLGIELAAARIRLFSPPALLARLTRSLPLLTGGAPQQLPARHETLRDTIAWSFNLLDPTEQTLFTRLAVFSGGCTFDGAAYIVRDLDLEDGQLLDRLLSLIDQNLLRQREEPDGEPRFRMLATIREFALEKLAEAPDAEMVHLSHAEFYTGLAEQFDAEARGPKFESWLGRLERDHDNVRAALHWLTRQDSPYSELAMRLAGSLFWFWFTRGHMNEGRAWLLKVVSHIGVDDPNLSEAMRFKRATIYNNAGALAGTQGDYAQASVMLTKSLEIVRSLGNKRGVARTLNNLGIFASHQGLYSEADVYFAESFKLKQEIQDEQGLSSAYNRLAEIAQVKGERERAETLYGEALALRRASGDMVRIAETLYNLAGLYFEQDDLVRAVSFGQEALSTAQQIEYKEAAAMAMVHLAAAYGAQGHYERAAPLLEESLAISRAIGDHSTQSLALKRCAEILAAKENYTDARALLDESLQIRLRLQEYNTEMTSTLEWLAYIDSSQLTADQEQMRAVRAAVILGATEARREVMGAPIPQVYRDRHARSLQTLHKYLGYALFSEAWQRGRNMTPDEAIALALRELLDHDALAPSTERVPSSLAAPFGLTEREIEVIGLLAQGLTNKEIGERLVLSHRTVQAHLYTIFNKLNVTTRSAAALAAVRHGLVQ
jgi:predicted ATPase/DNA-binding CsgD family transcriptional regulator/Tfp pilus assembly protein PilF